MLRCNIGCGQTLTQGWLNFDNSLSIRLAKYPLLTLILSKIGFLDDRQKEFITFARNNNIIFADATRKIPLPDKSVQVLYTSHMIEHLDQEEIKSFLNEAHRILVPNGIIRIAFPDLRKRIERYNSDNDADVFMISTGLARTSPRKFNQRLMFLLVGDRGHKYMYDSPSMVCLLSKHGFRDATVMEPGKTMIVESGKLNLCEREEESVYIEAFKL